MGSGSQEELVALLRSLAPIADDRARAQVYLERWVRPQLSASLGTVRAGLARADYVIDNLRNVWMRGDRVMPGASVTYEPPSHVDRLAKQATRRVRHGGALIELVALNERLVDPDGRWGEPYRFTGFWRAPWLRPWTAPAGLVAFLEAGPPPVVVTMGSMVSFDAERLLATLVRALERVGGRAVVVSGWADLSSAAGLPPSVHCVAEAPYDWLLPRASCVVHHGGCGTVAAVLRAGKPSILVPQISTQRTFGVLLARAGLVAGTLDTAAPDADALAAALAAVARGGALHRRPAARWSAIVGADAGVPTAADAIEAHWRALAAAPTAARADR